MTAPLLEETAVQYKTLGLRLEYISLSQLRAMGLDDATASELEGRADAKGGRRHAVVVMQRWGHSPAMKSFLDGDVLLSVDGSPISEVADVDTALVGKDAVQVELLRDGKRVTVAADTFDPMENLPVALDRVALWAGAVLQEVPQMAQWMWNSSPDGVFISAVAPGSPGQMYRLSQGSKIVEVDGVKTPSIDAFFAVVNAKPDGATVRIKLESLRGEPSVVTLTMNKTYWPATDISRVNGEWIRTVLDAPVESSVTSHGDGAPGTNPKTTTPF